MGRRDRAFVIRIVSTMVGKITPTGFRHSDMGYGCIQGTGARSGQNPAACPCILPFNFGRLPVGGKYRFKFGPSPAVTRRDWQEGNNVLLSGNIDKRVVTGNTVSWRSMLLACHTPFPTPATLPPLVPSDNGDNPTHWDGTFQGLNAQGGAAVSTS